MASALIVGCPFEPCVARVEVVQHKGFDLAHPAMNLIREHRLDPDAWFGLCPATSMHYPLNDEGRSALIGQARILDRMRKARADAADKAPAPAPIGEHSLWPKPNPHGSHSMGLRESRDPKKRYPLRVIKEGDRMATVAETMAAIQRANEQIAQAQEATRLATIKWEDARATLLWLRQNTVDPLGLPAVAAAIDACETAQRLGTPAIEANVTYGSGL